MTLARGSLRPIPSASWKLACTNTRSVASWSVSPQSGRLRGTRAQATRAFARNLAKLTPLPMLLWDERLSTAAAERALLEADVSRSRRAELIDKVAATLILQGALDRLKLFDRG